MCVVSHTSVVHNTTPERKPLCGLKYHAADFSPVQNGRMINKSPHRPTFIRAWRNHRNYSLDRLAEMVPMDKSNLSKVERGILPYNQEMLERLAGALMTDAASLLMRDPSRDDAMWSLWDKASPGERQQLEAVANALLSKRKTG